MDSGLVFDLVVRSMAGGVALAKAAALARSDFLATRGRWLGIAACLAFAAHAMLPIARQLWPEAVVLLAVPTLAAPLLYWMLVRIILVDGWCVRPWHWALLIVLEAIGLSLLFGLAERGSAIAAIAGLVLRGLALVLVVDALQAAWRGYRDDLIHARRRLRVALILAGPLAIALLLLPPTLPVAERAPFLLRVESALLLGFALVVALLVLRAEAVLAPPQPGPQPNDDEPDVAEVARVKRAMAAEPWRDSDLSLDRFAALAGIPVYRLRRVISRELGHRNFPAFVNAARLDAIALQLANPECARTPILTLALDHGFGSIGPFNRAFRERFGVTPTAYREANGGT